ncbi:MAG: signal recognition particle protein Srp19, partial [Nitrososphaerales archaeon]
SSGVNNDHIFVEISKIFDTFRPGALVQLRTLCSTSGTEVYGDEKETNSISVATKGVEYFRDLNKDVVIVDTAGRHKEERSLLDEMKTISKKVSPAYSLLVIDGTIGQQSFKQAEAFHQANPVGGLIISKLDGAAKGGGALAAAAATGASILYIGTGERIDDLEPFSPTRFAGRLLGMGDLKALLERAKDLETEADEEKIKRMMSGKMTIDDLYYQLEQIKKMGSIRKILELVPGFSTALGDKDLKNVEEDMDKWKFIIQSMSKHERQNPDVLNSSRMRRIAKGSGRNEREIKDLLQRYKQAKVVFKASKGRGMKQFMKKLAPQ